jgi:hypothetical protein
MIPWATSCVMGRRIISFTFNAVKQNDTDKRLFTTSKANFTQ